MTLENDIEMDFIHLLEDLKYTYRPDIRTRLTLEQNFREHFNKLNHVTLTDNEFSRLLESITTSDVYKASRTLREKNSLERDDGTPLYYTLVNNKDWCKNTFEVINQLRMNTEKSYHRYDVILLMNGIPVAQMELKKHDISPRKAMEQIIEYKNDEGNGYTRTLLCFMQIFMVSNGNETWYFANNNNKHFTFNADERSLHLYRFADSNNKKINKLSEFCKTFLSKCTLAETIGHYMVLMQTKQLLIMMRPYQIYAVKAIVDCIAHDCGNGYIWHTTGSGKTLTSFKAATLLKENPYIEKCLFVVDRKDLDEQTRKEFNKFQENCVEENTNTASLVERLLSTDYADKIIVTTIQKLSVALNQKDEKHGAMSYRERLKELRDKRMVFIFDECHRSQFGENHKAIKEFFPKAQLFGFTGTPISDVNAVVKKVEGQQASYITTDDVFQKCLHTYTITHAIDDGNVLRFHVDYFKPKTGNKGTQNSGITKKAVVESILEKHDMSTAHRKFNAILATSSISDAIEYYELFKKMQSDMLLADPKYPPLNIACVFSPPAEGNKQLTQLQEDLDQEREDLKHEPNKKKEALTTIIADYNTHYGTTCSISEFDTYYKAVQTRIKEQEHHGSVPHADLIDITIVVDMLLTGFDAPFLNTLYVDKNLKYHGLIQAFSRTNRTLNSTKPYGNILDFRQQADAVNEAIKLFSGEKQEDVHEIWLVEPAPKVIEKLQHAVKKLKTFMESQGLEATPSDVPNLKGNAARIQFVKCFKEVQRLNTQLAQYTDLTEEDSQLIEETIAKDDVQGFKGVYLEVAKRLQTDLKPQDQNEPTAEQLDFEFVIFASADIDYDYIMGLITDYTNLPAEKQTLSRSELLGIIAADAKFMDEHDDITEYINSLPLGTALDEKGIREGYAVFKAEKNDRDLYAIADKHGLAQADVKTLVETTMKLMRFDGESLRELVAPLGLGWKDRSKKEIAIMGDIAPFLRKLAKGKDISGLSSYE